MAIEGASARPSDSSTSDPEQQPDIEELPQKVEETQGACLPTDSANHTEHKPDFFANAKHRIEQTKELFKMLQPLAWEIASFVSLILLLAWAVYSQIASMGK